METKRSKTILWNVRTGGERERERSEAAGGQEAVPPSQGNWSHLSRGQLLPPLPSLLFRRSNPRLFPSKMGYFHRNESCFAGNGIVRVNYGRCRT